MKRSLVAAALGAIGLLTAFAAPFASDAPDGLQRVARDEGFSTTEREHALGDGPVAGYAVDGVEDERVSTGLSGAAGVVLVFALAAGAARLAARAGRPRDEGGGP